MSACEPRVRRRKHNIAYGYILQFYGVQFRIGQRVRHQVTRREGVVARPRPSADHYVHVRFDGLAHTLPCHPTELTMLEAVTA